jgi:hypothetical protein
MNPSGSLTGIAETLTRRWLIGASLTQGQIVCWAGLAGNGTLGDPASVNDYTEAIGILQSEDLTYSTTQGSGGVLGEVTYDPHQVVIGHVSGTTAAGAAWVNASTTNGNIMTEESGETAGKVLTDAGVGTSEFAGGYAVGLTGNNRGAVRVIDSHSDDTSLTMNDPFDGNIASGDTFLRTFAPGLQGIELTTNFEQFMGGGVAGVDLPDSGHGIVLDVFVAGVQIDGVLSTNRTRNLNAKLDSTTNPTVDIAIIFADHLYNSVA